MSVVFFGSGAFAVPALEAISAEVDLVVTQPDKPSGRGLRLQPSPVRIAAERLAIPVVAPERARAPEFIARIAAFAPQALIVASYGQILSETLLQTAKRGGINLHGSLLPAYRGAAPIQRAILNGDAVTGVTLMQMDKGMDSGDVIATFPCAISATETYGELQERLATIAADAIASWLPRILSGDYPRTSQDSSAATLAPKIDRAESVLDFNMPASEAVLRFRAFTPNPGVGLATRFGTWRLSEARLTGNSGAPGDVIAVKPSLVVAFASGSIELAELQPEGKKRMSGRDVANGLRLQPGDNLRSL